MNKSSCSTEAATRSTKHQTKQHNVRHQSSSSSHTNIRSRSTQDEQASLLPIENYKRTLLYLTEKNDVLIIVGETGSGKSTKIPEILLKSGCYNAAIDKTNLPEGIPAINLPARQQICITQPRRIAAIQLAERVSKNLGCDVGRTVGYTIRFQDVSNLEETKIKFVTEALLIREMMIDPLLSKYSVIILDEVHERNLQCDLLLGLLRCLLKKRNDLKLILCSATLDIELFEKFFKFRTSSSSTTQILKRLDILMVEGKTFPVEIYYRDKPVPDYVQATIETIIDIHESNRLGSGKILAFLTSQEEIEQVCDRLRDYAQVSANRLELRKLLIFPLHASLKAYQLTKIFQDPGRSTRVCIISTNVAETSLTIDDVKFIVDCGFTKLRQYDPLTGIDHLIRAPISKSSAKQRAGRAGRTRKGFVYRLYTKTEYDKLVDCTQPEISRSSMAETIMLLLSLGVTNLLAFPLPTPMTRENLTTGMELLYFLGAIDMSGKLTEDGLKMARFNIDAKLSKCLIESIKFGASREVCKIVAMLQVKELFSRARGADLWSNEMITKICSSEGDMISYLNILNGFLAAAKSPKWAQKRWLDHHALKNSSEVASQLENQLKRCAKKRDLSSTKDVQAIIKSLIAGLFFNAAYLHPNGDYKTIKGDQTVYIHPTSVLSELRDKPKYVIFGEIMSTTKVYMRHILAIDHKWLLEAAPRYYAFATDLEMQRRKG